MCLLVSDVSSQYHEMMMVLIPRVCASISKESLFRVRKEEKQRPEFNSNSQAGLSLPVISQHLV